MGLALLKETPESSLTLPPWENIMEGLLGGRSSLETVATDLGLPSLKNSEK